MPFPKKYPNITKLLNIMSGTWNVIPRGAADGGKQQIAAAGGFKSVLKELCRPPAIVSIQSPGGKKQGPIKKKARRSRPIMSRPLKYNSRLRGSRFPRANVYGK